jgi:predicted GH43/DUF377 family glycosyl hydrolase
MRLTRHKRNPIIVPNEANWWESKATFNCAATYRGGKIHLLYRAIGEYENYISRLGYAIFDENLNLVERFDSPRFVPERGEMACEDPRLTQLGNDLYMTYVSLRAPRPPGAVRKRLGIRNVTPQLPRTALVKVRDFNHFHRYGIITPPATHDKDTVLFPEKIAGRYAVIHRPRGSPNFPTPRPSIWFAYLESLSGGMYGHRLVMKPEGDWQSVKIGAGPPPVKTAEGWLLIWHGVDQNHVYRAGASLLDLKRPWLVIARSPAPILVPREVYERCGDVPNVVFPEGVVVIGDELFVFYGGADKVCCVAKTRLDKLIDYLLSV